MFFTHNDSGENTQATKKYLFISEGFNFWSRLTQKVEEHENTRIHRQNVDKLFMKTSQFSIVNRLRKDHIKLNKSLVEKRRKIMIRIIEVVKVIGKRGLSFRGSSNESGYNLDDDKIDHGNFLELILLRSTYKGCDKKEFYNA